MFQAQDLVSAIADNKSLRKLKLAHMKFDTITFNCLVELLRVNKSITEFDLRGIQHVDKQVFQLIEAMKLNTKLEFLDLQGNHRLGSPALVTPLLVNSVQQMFWEYMYCS